MPKPTLRELFLGHNAQTTHFPLLLEFVRAEGIYLFDPDGKAFIDLISGIGVSNLGHRHPEVVKAIKDQADKYLHLMVYGEYIQKPQTLFASKIASLLPPNLDSVYFVNSGAEAIEGALKLAKRITGRTGLLGFENSYHGSTHGALSLMGAEYYKNAYRPLLPDVGFLRFNHWEDLNRINESIAAVLIEPIQGEAGVRIPEPDYLRALEKKCKETGALLLLDEIQSGFGRTGKMFAFQHYSILPDILILAKSLGGGLPLGAFIASREKMSVFMEDPILGHITTFGGHPLCCAAGLASLEVLCRENYIDLVEEKSMLFHTLLSHPKIIQVRRKGFMIAVEFEDFTHNKRIIDRCIEKGILVDWFLHDSSSMRIAPPLIMDEENILKSCDIILKSIQEVYSDKITHSSGSA